MARYGPEHKAKTRRHLVETARAQFRAEGFDTLSIDKLMKAAGLTRGAFYAHFKSKEALVREVLAIEAGLVSELRQLEAGNPSAAADRIDAYLSPTQRNERIQCPLVAHPMDARRGGDARASLYEAQVRELIATLEHAAPGAPNTLATIVAIGAALLSSTIQDAQLAAEIEKVGSQHVRQLLAQGQTS